ncbi:hypothetical protein GJ744_008331 [Endocarpon pusillum]|uniref:Uncharacterized protein n=1 Tax=Endocarpon pusillum TaxID=364733 RepID=A0A8H7AKJ7_9EURO|nr:hypothetical protein GJ744_008331 [Endocarpon pusillum]
MLQQLICISRYLDSEEGLAVHFSISCPERLCIRADRLSPQKTKSSDESCASLLVIRSSIANLLNPEAQQTTTQPQPPQTSNSKLPNLPNPQKKLTYPKQQRNPLAELPHQENLRRRRFETACVTSAFFLFLFVFGFWVFLSTVSGIA